MTKACESVPSDFFGQLDVSRERCSSGARSPRVRACNLVTRAGVRVLAAMLISTGCSGHSSGVTLPSSPPLTVPSRGSLPSSPSVSPSPPTPRDAVVAAYTGFFPAVDQALRAPAEQIRAILGPYVAGDFLDFQVRQLVNQQAQHLEPWGRVIVHVTKVDIGQDQATVHDCQDASNAGLANAQTHELIPASRGTAHRNLTARLTLGGDGRWRLSDLRQFKAACRAS